MDAQEIMQRVFTEDGIKQEFEQTLSARVERYLRVKPHGIVPLTEFAPVSAECTLLFRDGHYYGSIALSQAVGETIVKFLCDKNGWKPKKSFEENVAKLETRQFMSESIKTKFLSLWGKRDDYHHLNPSIETDRQKLEVLAYEKVSLLKQIESEVFKFPIVDGRLVPENSKYWNLQPNGTAQVFLRLD
ncbi:MAG: hypothetical protein Q8O28_04145 [Smithellaceae bacterium]|nr:hypothetical protein [Smithellaceae bacterium]